ncbi:MAG: alpha/beta hydrolase [Candidatus Omnitrophica bacterium]|nr:alpha/beta hydrolase [Candidatus Omnitrophota bacterium]MDD5042328.1 alpha/beta hydrolase [Candidatus Omnitrophota bacterium]MDD5500447.1 alpha/beta hydrolase [Candidatus Omnitrophota bacterium]
MRKTNQILIALFFVFSIAISNAFAQNIQPVGGKVGVDKQGNAVYQIRANDIQVGYKLIGSGKPLVMIIGLGNTMEDWPDGVIKALSEKYQLILLDNRGMGYTTANDKEFSYELFAEDVISLLDTLGVKKTDVLGFSMGSTITQELLLKYPERFDKAIIYACSTDGSNVVKALEGKTPDNPVIARQVKATAQWKTPLSELPSINNQVMLIVGTADTIVGVEGSKMLAAAIPGAWLVQFKGATHSLMREAPVEFSRIVLAFLENNEIQGPANKISAGL